MTKFKVEITETLQYQEIIEADNESEAIDKLKDKYKNETIVLDDANHVNTEFAVIEKIKKRNDHSR